MGSKEDLQTYAREGYERNTDNCSGSTHYVADKMGHSDLPAGNANNQIDHMENNWNKVDGKTAQDLANNGTFVVAGLPSDGGHGHTMVVTPGKTRVADGKEYPTVTGGGMKEAGRSQGDKTAADTYPRTERNKVQYYTPK